MYTTLIHACTLYQHHRDSDWAIIDCHFDLSQPAAGHVTYLASHIPVDNRFFKDNLKQDGGFKKGYL